MLYRPKDWYERMKAEPVLGRRAVKLDAETKTVTTDDGKTYPYDALLVATGSRPFVPPFAGLDKVKNKTGFMTLDDAEKLDSMLTPTSRAMIMGAGLIGLKCAECIAERVGSTVVADLAPRILPAVLDEECSAELQKRLEKHGISFMLGDTATEFTENSAKMKSGAEVCFDVLVLAVGVRPNVELVTEADGKAERGIIVDERMRTALPNVYAAGDCVVSNDLSADCRRILALMPNAYMQGEIAGTNMAGGEAEQAGAIPSNSAGFFGYHIATAGTYAGECRQTREEGAIKKLFYHDNRLVGLEMLGNTDRAGIYAAMIRGKTALDTLDFDLICDRPSLAAFSRADRDAALAGKEKA